MKSLRMACCLIPVVVLAISFMNAALAEVQTAMFQNGPQHTGVYASDTEGAFVRLKWKFKTQGRIHASPIVCGDLCLVGGEDAYLHALDAKTGGERWRYKTDGAVRSTAAVSGGTVFVVSMDGCLHALDLESGKPRWRFATGGEKVLDAWDAYLSSPCVEGGAVYFGGGDGNLYAVDQASGKEIWRFGTKGIIHSSPAVRDLVYFGNGEGRVCAVDRKTGALQWQFKTLGWTDIPKGEVMSSPSLADGILYIGARDHAIYALDALTGAEKWHTQNYPGWVVSTPAVKDGTVYYGRTGDYTVYAREAANGAIKWSCETPYFIYSSPAVAGRTLYIGCFDGRLYALDLQTGKVKWTFQTDGSKEHHAEFFDEIGWFRTEIYQRFDEATAGQSLFDYLVTVGSVLSSPWISAETVYFGSTDGCLYALEVK